MSVKSKPFYWLECDECQRTSTDDGEFAAWADESSAFDEATESDWLVESDRHLCDQCADALRCDKCGEFRPGPDVACADCVKAATDA